MLSSLNADGFPEAVPCGGPGDVCGGPAAVAPWSRTGSVTEVAPCSERRCAADIPASRRRMPSFSYARAGNHHFGLLSALRAHTKHPYKNLFTMGNAKGA